MLNVPVEGAAQIDQLKAFEDSELIDASTWEKARSNYIRKRIKFVFMLKLVVQLTYG